MFHQFSSTPCLNFLQSILKRKEIVYSCHSLHASTKISSSIQRDTSLHSAVIYSGKVSFLRRIKSGGAVSSSGRKQIREIFRRRRSNFRRMDILTSVFASDESGKFEWPSRELFTPSTFTFIQAAEHCRDGIQRKPASLVPSGSAKSLLYHLLLDGGSPESS